MDNHPDQLARMTQLEKQRCCKEVDALSINDWGPENNSLSIHDVAGKSTSFPLGLDMCCKDVIQVQKLSEQATIPTKANATDAGYDLYALENTEIFAGKRRLVRTGVAMAIPEGYAGLIWPRSGLAVKQGIDVFAGVIDSGYRGEIRVCLYNSCHGSSVSGTADSFKIKAGDRIAQILFQNIEDFELYEVKDLDSTARGHGGFGSSGA